MTGSLTRRIVLLTALLALPGCFDAEPPRHAAVEFVTQAELTVNDMRIAVAIADTPEQREKGLMRVPELPKNSGMLFVFPDEAPRSFWMKDTLIPLDIAFLDRQGKIVQILAMQPGDLTLHSSGAPARYALEMNQGWFAANGVAAGDVITDLPSLEPNGHGR